MRMLRVAKDWSLCLLVAPKEAEGFAPCWPPVGATVEDVPQFGFWGYGVCESSRAVM